MCGIFALLSRHISKRFNRQLLEKGYMTIQPRGPDGSKLVATANDRALFGFHRLRINDLSEAGDQPMRLGPLTLVCNGEIYNHMELTKKYGFKRQSGSDCEIVLHMVQKFGVERAAKELDGVFAFTVYDEEKDELYAARDPMGVRPLFMGECPQKDALFFASEAKAFIDFTRNVKHFPPGYTWSSKDRQFKQYWFLENSAQITDEKDALDMIHESLSLAAKKRMMSSRPIGSFLSGGLDSSLVTALLARMSEYPINTYSVGMEGATDLAAGQLAAEHVKTNHRTVLFNFEDALEAIPEIIYRLETYDVVQVRSGIGMYMVSKFVAENSDDVVMYSGEGSDEVAQGYMYFHNAPSAEDAAVESKKLVDNLHFFDNKRVDRMTAAHGLEVRVPFLDREFVQKYFTISPELRTPSHRGIEKYLVRKAFDRDDLLPPEVLWRAKEGLSDGVSGTEDPIHLRLQNYAASFISDEEFRAAQSHSAYATKPFSKEALWYRQIYEQTFGGADFAPYYWFPQWSNISDPSARNMKVYGDRMED